MAETVSAVARWLFEQSKLWLSS